MSRPNYESATILNIEDLKMNIKNTSHCPKVFLVGWWMQIRKQTTAIHYGKSYDVTNYSHFKRTYENGSL